MPQVAIVMPKMSMTMTEGELLVWHVEVGQEIKAGQVVCEVATDKVDMEVEATASGTVTQLIGNPGDVMDVGAPLVMVESDTDDMLAGIFDAPAAAATLVTSWPHPRLAIRQHSSMLICALLHQLEPKVSSQLQTYSVLQSPHQQ